MLSGLRVPVLLFVIIIGILFTGCVMNKLDHSPRTIKLKQSLQGKPVRLDITAGKEYSKPMQAGPFIFNILPQIVIWAENSEGKLVETLYITGADGKEMRNAAKNSKGAAFYQECFPVWASRMKEAGLKLPGKDNPYPDSVTSATPAAGFSLFTKLKEDKQEQNIFLEVNQSADTNTVYTEKLNGWAGQPSLIYRCQLPKQKGTPVQMDLIGHGGLLSDKSGITSDLTGFDTALQQLEKIMVRVEE